MDTTVIPPADVLDAAVRPCSLPSLGSVLAADRFCPECDRDLADALPPGHVVVCETCVAAADHDPSPAAGESFGGLDLVLGMAIGAGLGALTGRGSSPQNHAFRVILAA